MKRKFTFLTAAFMLLAFLAVPLGMRGQTRATIDDVLTAASFTATSTTYTDFSGVTFDSDAVYAGNSGKTASGGIQLRSKNSNSGIVSTTSGGTINAISVVVESGSNTLDVYGKNTAYSAASDLYNSSTQGTKIGSISATGTVDLTTYVDQYEYIGLRSNNGALYLTSITITWTTSGGTNPTYTVTYDANGGTGTMTDPNSPYEVDDEVTLLENTFEAPEGKKWDSWSVKDANNQAVTVTNDKFNMPASNVTVTAQWVDDPSAPQYNWVLTDLADLTSSDVFVIVGNNGNNYAMSNNNGTGSAPSAVSVTVADNKITSTVASTIQWNISGDATDGYVFYPKGSTETWLYCNNTNNGVRVGTNDSKTFKIANGYLKHDGTSRYVGVYNSLDWRCYSVDNPSSHQNIGGQTFAFYKKVAAGAIPPSITANNVDILFNAENGNINYTIHDAPNPAGTLTAAVKEGTTPTIANFSIGTVTNSTVTFSCSSNTEATERMATVTLTYTYGENQIVTKDVVITQAAAPVIYSTIPEIFAAATNIGGTASNVNVTFENWVVSGVSGSNAFVTDNNGNGFIIYTSNHGFVVNDKLSGTVMGTPLKLYNGSAEFTNLTDATDGLSTSTDGTITVITNKTIADLGGVNTGAVITLSNLTYDGTNLSDGTNTIKPYNTLFNSMSFSNGKTYNVTGVYQQYTTNNSDTKEILPRSAADIEEVTVTTPSITVYPASANVTAAGDFPEFAVSYENLTIADETDFALEFFESDGTTVASQPSWITDYEFNPGATAGYELMVEVDENTGAQRVAYLKVWALDDVTPIYSNLITITQAAPVIDYATLPFEFTGGYADIANTNGLTQSGLGTDYSDENSKLKFNNDDVNLVLKLNAAPKAITFNIKGNGFSEGIFTVQISEDGTTYTNLATYTENEITNSNQTFTLLNTNEDVRYIRWYFTDKVTGNIGVGNIYVDDEYLVKGMATVVEDLTLDECTIAATGTLTVASGTLNVTTSLTNQATTEAWNNLVIKDGAQLKTPNEVNGTVEKVVAGYGSSEKNNYVLLATPATMDACNHTGMWNTADQTQHANVDLYAFDQKYNGEEWRNYKYGNTYFAGPIAITQGTGYLYANKEDVTLTLETRGYVAPNTSHQPHPFSATSADIDVAVSYSNDKPFAGWNLIGNPFTCKAYLADGSDFYRMNADGNGLIINTDAQGGGNAINVCEGIFVETTAAETKVTFTTTDPTVTSTGNNNGMVNISVAQVVNSRDAQPSADYARIRVNNGKDMTKFVFNENTSRVYIPQGNKDYAVVRSEARGEMPVNFKAAADGTYTISVEAENLDVNYLHLIDNITGMDVDLLATPSYTFEGKRTDYASRFRLVFDANTGNDETNDNFAFINNGELIVNGNGTVQVIDILGRQMFSHEVNSAFRIQNSSFAPGVYVLRLVNGNDVKTQKIVIK